MMAASSSRTRSSGHVHGRSALSAGRPCSSFASSSSSFSAAPRSTSAFGFHGHHRAASPTRVRLSGTASPPLRLSFADRPTSPGGSLISKKQSIAAPPPASRRRTCMCSPTTHPGSFRCALHKNAGVPRPGGTPTAPSPSSPLNARRSAMANSLVRIGTVEGSDLIRRALTALIRPSSHQQRRRAVFQHRPSRLSIMSKADDELC